MDACRTAFCYAGDPDSISGNATAQSLEAAHPRNHFPSHDQKKRKHTGPVALVIRRSSSPRAGSEPATTGAGVTGFSTTWTSSSSGALLLWRLANRNSSSLSDFVRSIVSMLSDKGGVIFHTQEVNYHLMVAQHATYRRQSSISAKWVQQL